MKRGEVWKVNLDPTIGAEIQKIRPCVIVARDALARLPLTIIVPITEWDDRYAGAAWHIPIDSMPENGLDKKSSADTFQVRSVSNERLIETIGELPVEVMDQINYGLAISLALTNP